MGDAGAASTGGAASRWAISALPASLAGVFGLAEPSASEAGVAVSGATVFWAAAVSSGARSPPSTGFVTLLEVEGALTSSLRGLAAGSVELAPGDTCALSIDAVPNASRRNSVDWERGGVRCSAADGVAGIIDAVASMRAGVVRVFPPFVETIVTGRESAAEVAESRAPVACVASRAAGRSARFPSCGLSLALIAVVPSYANGWVEKRHPPLRHDATGTRRMRVSASGDPHPSGF
jgi:hypothetical protein